MSVRDKVRAHLVREARKRVLDDAKQVKLRPAALSTKLAEAADGAAFIVDQTIANLRKSAALCEHIVATYGHEYPPELTREIAERGKWKREMAEELEAEQRGR